MTPWFTETTRRVVRAPVNPLDKTTIVSIFPKEVMENKPTIFPGRFILPPGSYEKPSILVVGPSSWWREVDEYSPLLEIPVNSYQIAKSIVDDFCNGLLACNMVDRMPGIFCLPGEVTMMELKTKHKKELDEALNKQRNWYSALVEMADSLWARSNGNPMVIGEDMKLAAKELGINREWISGFQLVELVRCAACGALRDPRFPICRECKAIADPEKAKELGLKFAV